MLLFYGLCTCVLGFFITIYPFGVIIIVFNKYLLLGHMHVVGLMEDLPHILGPNYND